MNENGFITIWREPQCGKVVWKWGRKGGPGSTVSEENFTEQVEAEQAACAIARVMRLPYQGHDPKNDHPPANVRIYTTRKVFDLAAD